ncbi:MAG: hypothetical protein LUF85_11725 [Bacteroides sp.]|nr:hypothetical protein [Bacteroides sp.]
MNKLLLVLAILFLLFCGCTFASRDDASKQSLNEVHTDSPAQPAVAAAPHSGIIPIQLNDGHGQLQVHKEKDETIYLEFNSDGYDRLQARIFSADSLANLRFSQIVLPNGNTDGPFGGRMDYMLPIHGIYRLLIHENRMAGDPWGGYFTVEINLLN